jgi:glucosamine--fructose-6-phosphate aminotransferase (isomerizing)
MPGSIAIGHTRWATHGGVTVANAHPHCDCGNRIAVVHNGTIDNYQELRRELSLSGHTLVSETDTEVIPHLLEEMVKKGLPLEKAVPAAAAKLEGAYAFLAISCDQPDVIVGIRKESPLAVGICNQGTFAGSDALVFPKDVTKLVAIDDNEMVILHPDNIEFFDVAGNKLNKQFQTPDFQWNDSDKEGHRFFMMKEILEQTATLEYAIEQDKEMFTEIALDILRAGQVIITACGTSRYAALVGRYLFSRIGKKFCDVVMSSEFHYFADSVDKNTVVIAVSQSGETADVIEGVKRARAAGAKIISIVNRPMSLLSSLSDRVIRLIADRNYVSQLPNPS